jgi:DNA polymerase-3 subunit delta
MPPRAADKFIKDVSSRDLESLRQALAAMADLEVQTRGGLDNFLTEDTVAIQAVLAAAA